MSLDPSGESNTFYADDTAYAVLTSNSGYEGDFESAVEALVRKRTGAFLRNKTECRNRACTDFYMTANVHRADRRDAAISRHAEI